MLYTFTVVSNMPLTAAEKQRRYRARKDQDQERRKHYLLQEKEKYKRDREQGKKKSIEECNEAEKVLRRRRWRADQEKTSAARKATAAAVNSLSTPPESPESDHQEVARQEPGPSRLEQ